MSKNVYLSQHIKYFFILKILILVELTTLLVSTSTNTVRQAMETLQLKNNSTSANNSLVEIPAEDNIRCCIHCLVLLEARKDLLTGRNEQPPITGLYQEIQQIREKVNLDIKMYLKITQSLYNGDTTYSLSDAIELRSNIAKMAEMINLKCKTVCSLPCESVSRSSVLQKAIRLSCCQFIQEKVLTLSQPPKGEEIAKIQERRRMEAEERIAIEQKLVMEAYEKQEFANKNMVSHPEVLSYARGVRA